MTESEVLPPLSAGEGAPKSFVRTFPCSGCGAKLAFAPGTKELACEHCGTRNAIAEDDARVEELDLDAYLKALEGQQESFEAEAARCTKCGAEQRLPDHHFASQCAFCGGPIVSQGYARRLVKPRAMVPFQVPRTQAQEAFRRWVKGLWLAPGELKRQAQSDAAMAGTYLPFWTYDCRTSSDYRGERGEDYYTDETYTTKSSTGATVSRTRQVQHTRWESAAGHVERFHDDVLVPASPSLPPSLTGATLEWKLGALVPYQAEYVSGYSAEAYRVGLREAFPLARARIDAAVQDLVRRDIGGDRQRVHRVDTRYSDVRFKHVLLPVWMSAYRFRDRTYRFLVNGQTGEVAGESPVSWQKTTLLVIGVVLLILFLIWLLH